MHWILQLRRFSGFFEAMLDVQHSPSQMAHALMPLLQNSSSLGMPNLLSVHESSAGGLLHE